MFMQGGEVVVVWLIAVFRWLRLDDPDLALPAP